MKKATSKNALAAWEELAFMNERTDAAVNDLLEEIAGKKYMNGEDDDDPIWTTMNNLTNSERRRFIRGCDEIRVRYGNGGV